MIPLTSRPRARLCHLPTPIEYLERLSAHLGGPRIFIKRDDATGLAFGGNKARKLEFILGDARRAGADLLLTAAGVQSNHARQTAAAAARFGMSAELVLARMVPYSSPDYEMSGNVLLDRLLGATTHIVDRGTDVRAFLDGLAAKARSRGRHPYIVPFGGSAPPGTFGYVDAAFEIMEQAKAANLTFGHVIHATGSGGTQGGFVCGFSAAGPGAPKVLGISVLSKDKKYRDDVAELASLTAAELGLPKVPDAATVVDYDHVGEAYGIPTPGMLEAVSLAARLEGLLLDPVYTGKAFAGMIAMIRDGRFSRDETLLFIHTGGTPALFPYRTAFDAVTQAPREPA